MFQQLIESLERLPFVRHASLNQEKKEKGDEFNFYIELKESDPLESADGHNFSQKDRELESNIIDNWRQIYQNIYDCFEENPFACWISKYDHQQIPHDQMEAWIEATAQRIGNFKPQTVLEIGFGVGLLLKKIAPDCNHYVGCDICENALQKLQQELKTLPHLNHVKLFQSAAHEFKQVTRDLKFDMIVLNSVIQYFPSLSYLTEVIEQALSVLNPKGVIFIGDVRSLEFLNLFFISLHRFQNAPIDLTTLNRYREQEPELVVSGHYFHSLKERFPLISSISLEPKQEEAQNELTKFRYDVTLYVGEVRENLLLFENWNTDSDPRAHLEKRLQNRGEAIIALSHIPNPSLKEEVRIFQDLIESRQTTEREGIYPYELLKLSQKYGYCLKMSSNRCDPSGSFDAVFYLPHSTFNQKEEWIRFDSPQKEDSVPHLLATTPSRVLKRKIYTKKISDCIQPFLKELKCRKNIFFIN